jgi:multicomponent Na+:H+ antiporter subunit G
MTAGEIAVAALLALTVAFELISCAGLWALRTPFDRLHLTGLAAVTGPVLLAVAVLIDQGLGQAGIKAILIALLVLITGPVLTHAIARVAYLREFGSLAPQAARAKEGE